MLSLEYLETEFKKEYFNEYDRSEILRNREIAGYMEWLDLTMDFPEGIGTADTVSFDQSRRMLRIHDLKTVTTPAKL